MSENWPAPTPREEMLARVAARGTRIRVVRGAVNAFVILSVVGASALGVGAVIGDLGDSTGTEVDNIAMVPEPPDPGVPISARPGQPASTAPDGPVTTDGSETTDVGEVATPSTGSTGGSGTTGSGTSVGGSSTSTPGSSTSAPGSPTTTAGSSTTRPSTTSEPGTTSTTAVPAPRVGPMRTKVDGGVPTGTELCSDPSAVIAVSIEGADHATVTWNRAGESRTAELTAGAEEWSAPIPEIDEKADDVPVIVTVVATGPGGTTHTSAEIPVADCTPPSSAPSAQRP